MTSPRVRACVAFAVFVFASLVPIGASSPLGHAASGLAPSAAAAPVPVLLEILQSELNRNVGVLKSQPVPPYYVSYTVYDTQSSQIDASFGAVVADVDDHARTFGVDVRTGDYALDNTHEIRGDPAPPAALGRAVIPLTDSAPAIDVAAWQATDRAYHQSVERLARVKTNLAAKVKEEDPAPDFSREDPQVFVGKPATYQIDKAAWQARLRRVSAVFAVDPLVLQGEAALSVEASTRYMVSTEGSRLLTGDLACRLSIQAQTKADDGMELPLYTTYFARSLAGLPSEAKLLDDARSMVALLARLRTAPVVDPYTGPAILSGRAAGVFFHEIFGHRIEGSRQKAADDAQTFSKKVGEPVLPSFLSVVADPTLQKLGDTELAGTYQFDDEGVRAQRVSVVDHGTLHEFLLSRSPLARFPRSNGHGRAQAGLRPISRQSNLLVESSTGVPFPQLVERLKDEARKAGKPFGLLFDQVEGGFTYTARFTPNAFNVTPVVVYRVYTDSRPMELVRGVDIIGTPLSAFNRIVATDNRPQTFNGICGAESGAVPVSASSPALLVSEVEVQKMAKSEDSLPILPAPSARAASQSDSPVLHALGDELSRSVSGLKLKDEPAPYYVGYSVTDTAASGFHATLGAIVSRRAERARLVRADVRVGSYAFDSSRFLASGLAGGMASLGMLPIDDNQGALRREAWLTTDAAYKNAVQVFSRKKATFENRSETDRLPDFSRSAPIDYVEPAREALPAPPEWGAIVEEISKSLGVPEAVASDVSLDLNDGTRYFINSEGTRVAVPARVASFRAAVTVLGDDGMPVSASVALAARPEDLPNRSDLLSRTLKMLDDVMTTRAANVADDYSGPVLVEGDAAVSLVSQSLVPLFLARRPVDSDRGARGGGAAASTPYLSRIGNRVLPESFSVTDTPSVTRLLDQPAGGAYVVDDEGVKAQDVTLVSNGRLITLLTSRTPQRNLAASNGHMRGSGPQAGVFQVESADGVPAAELKSKYLALLKTQGRPFGYILRRLGQLGRDGLSVTAAVRVTPDGREVPVRGLLLESPAHTAFRDIAGASKDRTAVTHLAGSGAAMAQATMVTVVAPNLIFEELDLQRNKDPLQKKAIVPSPLAK
jgi:predicted Zn-dependent protease